MEIDGGPTPDLCRIEIDPSMLIGVERHPKTLEIKMTETWSNPINKRRQREMKEAGEEIPEYVLPPKDIEKHEKELLKNEVRRLRQQEEELNHKLSVKKEEERERLLEAAPKVAVSPAARELAEKESVNLAEITGSGVNSRITLGDVRQAIEGMATE